MREIIEQVVLAQKEQGKTRDNIKKYLLDEMQFEAKDVNAALNNFTWKKPFTLSSEPASSLPWPEPTDKQAKQFNQLLFAPIESKLRQPIRETKTEIKETATNQLILAVKLGNTDEVVRLITEGNADINTGFGKHNATPLLYCCNLIRLHALARTILTKCPTVDINATDNNQLTPLHMAAMTGDLETVKLLVEKKADINPANERMTLVHAAADRGHTSMLKYLLHKLKLPITQDDSGRTPYHHIAAHKSISYKEYSCKLQEIERDGHCFYNAVIDQLKIQGNKYKGNCHTLRQEIQDGLLRDLEENKVDEVVNFVGPNNESAQQYINSIVSTDSNKVQWAGELEMSYLIRHWNATFIIFYPDRHPIIQGSGNGPIHLLHYDGRHYSSLHSVMSPIDILKHLQSRDHIKCIAILNNAPEQKLSLTTPDNNGHSAVIYAIKANKQDVLRYCYQQLRDDRYRDQVLWYFACIKELYNTVSRDITPTSYSPTIIAALHKKFENFYGKLIKRLWHTMNWLQHTHSLLFNMHITKEEIKAETKNQTAWSATTFHNQLKLSLMRTISDLSTAKLTDITSDKLITLYAKHRQIIFELERIFDIISTFDVDFNISDFLDDLCYGLVDIINTIQSYNNNPEDTANYLSAQLNKLKTIPRALKKLINLLAPDTELEEDSSLNTNQTALKDLQALRSNIKNICSSSDLANAVKQLYPIICRFSLALEIVIKQLNRRLQESNTYLCTVSITGEKRPAAPNNNQAAKRQKCAGATKHKEREEPPLLAGLFPPPRNVTEGADPDDGDYSSTDGELGSSGFLFG